MKKYLLGVFCLSLIASAPALADCPQDITDLGTAGADAVIAGLASNANTGITDFSKAIGVSAESGIVGFNQGDQLLYLVQAKTKSQQVTGVIKCSTDKNKLIVLSSSWASAAGGNGVMGGVPEANLDSSGAQPKNCSLPIEDIGEAGAKALINSVASDPSTGIKNFSDSIGKTASSGITGFIEGNQVLYLVQAKSKSQQVSGVVRCNSKNDIVVLSASWISKSGSGVIGESFAARLDDARQATTPATNGSQDVTTGISQKTSVSSVTSPEKSAAQKTSSVPGI